MSERARSPRSQWMQAVKQSDMSRPAIQTVIELATFGTAKGDRIFPSRETLAARRGLKVRAVASHLAEARNAGWITVHRRAQGRHVSPSELTYPDGGRDDDC